MRTGIIIDFNHTLYDPGVDTLHPDALALLDACRHEETRIFLVSAAGPGRRELITRLGLDPFFDHIIVTAHKSQATFDDIQNRWPAKEWIVIGDRIKREITYGNTFGATTIWIQRGKFATELPENNQEQPSYTVHTLAEVIPIISSLLDSL